MQSPLKVKLKETEHALQRKAKIMNKNNQGQKNKKERSKGTHHIFAVLLPAPSQPYIKI